MGKKIKKLQAAIVDFLRQGTTPHELALAIALGVIIGMFPVQGTTTLICALAATLFRLNMVVIQLANYISFPLTMVMLVPFYTLGNSLFNQSTFKLDFDTLVFLFQTNFLEAVKEISWSISYAVFVWLLFAPAGILTIYFISIKVIRRLKVETPS